jgi:hypothetical protein
VSADLDLYSGLPKTGNSLAVWADDARQAASVASSLAPTPFVPQSLRGRDDRQTAANITAAILTGAELGLTPMASLRSIVVIQGTPAMTAVALRGLVQSAGHDIWIESSSDSRVVACGRRRGSDQVEKAVWTIDRAQKLGLTGKDNWKKQPESMLVARATSEVARRIAADVLLGLPYSVEEIADTVESEPQRTARRRTQRETPPTPEPPLEPEPPLVPSPPEIPPLPAAEDPITDAQSRKLHAALRDAGLGDREAGLAYISQTIDREIASSKELSKAEASVVIDSLEESPPEPTLEWPEVTPPGGDQ